MINKDQLNELVTKAFNDGQVKGIELACKILAEAILEFKDKIIKMPNKEKEE